MNCRPRESGGSDLDPRVLWVPAFAGMTEERLLHRYFAGSGSEHREAHYVTDYSCG